MDADLRNLARSAPEDAEAAARLLAERVRSGSLSHERIRLAAYLGDPAALLACLRAPPPRVEEWSLWLEGLRSDPTGVPVLQELEDAAVGQRNPDLSQATDRVLDRLGEEGLVRLEGSGEVGITAAGRILLNARNAVACDEAWWRASTVVLRLVREEWDRAEPTDWRPRKLNETLEEWIVCPCDSHSEVWTFWNKLRKRRTTLGDAHEAVAANPGLQTIARSLVMRELVPWALGLHDPVRLRVEARRSSAL